MAAKRLDPVHPGEILREEFLQPMDLAPSRVARDLGLPPRRLNEIVLGKRPITADTALRLARYFDMSAQFWMNLQVDYDLSTELERLGDRLVTEVKRYNKTE